MKINLSEINNIDLNEIGKKYIKGPLREGEHKWGYRQDAFFGEAGKEHYKLLAYFSTLFDNSTIVDIGTFRGYSALALSYNKSNKVFSFDLHAHMFEKSLEGNPENVEFIVDDVLKPNHLQLLSNSEIIFLDADHHGKFEAMVHDYLKKTNYQGIMICDDIYFDGSAGMNMVDWWDSIKTDKNKHWWETDKIKLEKYDLTEYGHGALFGNKPCGTGLIDFSGKLKLQNKVGEMING